MSEVDQAESVDRILAKRKVAKGGITRVVTFLNKIDDNTTIEDLTTRLDSLYENWQKYDSAQSTLEEEDYDQYFQDREQFEEKFLNTKAKLERLVNQAKQNETDARSETTSPPVVTQESTKVRPNLPKLSIPVFTGDYQDWQSFIDLFDVMIHQDEKIPDIQKFFYLKTALKGEPSTLIESLSTTADNYKEARKLLEERYNNKQVILNSHLKAIFDIPIMTKESSNELRKLTTSVKQHMRAIQALKVEIDNWDPMIIFVIKQKFDAPSKRQWELENKTPTKIPTLKEFYEFLENRCFALESLVSTREADKGHRETEKIRPKYTPKDPKVSHFVATDQQINCQLCRGNHYMNQCSQFLKKSIPERIEFIKSKKMCFNCLKIGHSCRDCRSRHCTKCKKYHHTLIHEEKDLPVNETDNQIQQTTEVSKVVTTSLKSTNSDILLSTAVIQIQDSKGQWHSCRVLLDSGSQVNFITESFCKRLNHSLIESNNPISGINQINTTVTHFINVTMKSVNTNYQTSTSCFIIPKITINLPSRHIDTRTWQLPKVQLADPEFHKPHEIDLLLGAELYFELLVPEQINIGPELPILQNSSLGWLISGKINKSSRKVKEQQSHVCHFTTMQLPELLESFWQLEDVDCKPKLSKEEQLCEENFKTTHSRDEDGKFIVRLPRKSSFHLLGQSKLSAKKRLYSMEKKMTLYPEIKTSYVNFMNEYENLKHMSEITTSEDSNPHYYLPHHSVTKETSETTRLRVVFDGSHKTDSGYSLNDVLLTGPKLQSPLMNILLRFRQHTFVLSGDIEKMYRMIWIHPEDQQFQQILWRNESTETIKTFKLNTVTYGLSCSPYLAIRCLKQLSDEHQEAFPEASLVIDRDFYVDDMLTGSDDLMTLRQLKDDVTTILESAGFHMRKWKSNHTEFSDTSVNLNFNVTEITQLLGLYWDSQQDYIRYFIKKDNADGFTKRQILSQIAKLFDPIGLLSPIILQAKMLIQQLWSLKCDWDDYLPESIVNQWHDFKEELLCIEKLVIPRHVILPGYEHLQMHIFADASEQGYGSAVYLRSSIENQHQTRLLTAKSKVAPVKKLTLPRLELCAALLAVRLHCVCLESLTTNINSITFWSDSTIVLQWLQKEPNQLQTFVGNRVSEIQSNSDINSWRHVPSQENPADIASRGANTMQLITSEMWWKGPKFLSQNEETWPTNKIKLNPDFNLECKKTTHHTVSTARKRCDMFQVFSSWSKLIRSIAYLQRFIVYLQNKQRNSEPILTVNDLLKAELKIIQLVQEDCFSDELKDLQSRKLVNKRSSLKSLNPYFDPETKVIRVGGRLRKSQTLTSDEKHPAVIPAHHFITTMMLREKHEKLAHCGSEQLLAAIRLRYWPIHGKRSAKAINRSCIQCIRYQPTVPQYIMADLPQVRIEQKRPFSSTGVDYAGPITLRESKRRGRVHTFKAYVAVFVCLKTKAVHLELVSSLTTESFIAALRRFIARRGLCSELYSDRGTNFVGAFNELKEVYTFLKEKNQDLQKKLANMNIHWTFIPPRSPHFGGIWEAAVKSFKRHFYKVTRKVIWTFEECTTLLAQIEAILNSRPLVANSCDPNNLSFLSPAHFIIGDYLLELPAISYSNLPDNKLSNFQHIQKIKEHFWNRWRTDYLQSLQQRVIWQQGNHNIEINDIVFLLEDNTTPLYWPLGRVIQVHPGSDGIVRVARVKTEQGEFTRPVKKLCKILMN